MLGAMSIWGAQPFDNDGAVNWAFSLVRGSDLSLVEQALARIEATGSDPVPEPAGAEAIAACDVLARLKGAPGEWNEYSDVIANWVAARRPRELRPELIARGRAAILRIQEGPSKLRDLWDQNGAEAWRTALADLDRRLAAGSEQAGQIP